MTLRASEGQQLITLQVVVDQVVQPHLVWRRLKLDRQWQTLREVNVLVRIPTQGTFRDRRHAVSQIITRVIAVLYIPLAESIERIEVVRAEHRDEPIQLFQPVPPRPRSHHDHP